MNQPPNWSPPAPHRHRVRRVPLWPWLAGAGALLFIAGTFVFAFWVTSDDDTPTGGSATPVGLANPDTLLRQAFSACQSGDLADADHTLVIDTEGEEPGSGTDTFDALSCTLGELDTPQSVIARMDQTRALDGMQTAEWAGFAASWTYHPDDGLDLIITEAG